MSLLDIVRAVNALPPKPTGGILGQVAAAKGLLTVADDTTSFSFIRGEPVRTSKDLERVQALPRRVLDVLDPEPAKKWTAALRREVTACDCVKRWGFCITELSPIQGVALEEAHHTGRLVALVGTGHGKTGIMILLPMVMGSAVSVLLIPPKLRSQFKDRDYPQWSIHFKVPNLAGGNAFTPGRPVLNVVAYSELSQAKSSDILTRLRPDLVMADEAQNLKDPTSARTKRFRRMDDAVRFVPASGTMTTRSPKDCAHLIGRALGEGSPLPLSYPVVEEWAGALDASPFPKPMGALSVFCKPGENAQEGFQRRLVETPGVVATSTASIDCSLYLTALTIDVPEKIRGYIEMAKHGTRPDTEETADRLVMASWARCLAAGFYHRWVYPRGEPRELIDTWFAARKAYNKEMRDKLKFSREFMDSPDLLARAAIRWTDGYTFEGKHYEPHTAKGPLPVWASVHWPEWRAVHKQVRPESEPVWESDFLIDAGVRWGEKNTGIIWTEHSEFGARLAKKLGTVWYNGGGLNPESEKGDRTIVCSLRANSEGLNLQHAFSKNLYLSVPSSGQVWEQSLARTHRKGQKAEAVEVDIYLHTTALANAFQQARRDARYQQNVTKNPQKLCYGDFDLTLAEKPDLDR